MGPEQLAELALVAVGWPVVGPAVAGSHSVGVAVVVAAPAPVVVAVEQGLAAAVGTAVAAVGTADSGDTAVAAAAVGDTAAAVAVGIVAAAAAPVGRPDLDATAQAGHLEDTAADAAQPLGGIAAVLVLDSASVAAGWGMPAAGGLGIRHLGLDSSH